MKPCITTVTETGEVMPTVLPKQGFVGSSVKKKKIKKEAVIGLIFILIPLVGYVIFSGFPLLFSFMAQFCDMKGYDISSLQWNNFANFRTIFTDQRFYKSIGITVWVYTAQLISLAIALVIAALLAQNVRGSRVLEVIFFIPYICSSVAVASMWMWVFDARNGILNALLGTQIDWLANLEKPSTITWAIIVATVWASPAYGIIMYKAAFKGINPAYYEAASIDGANGFKKFLHITVPSLAPTTLFLLVQGVIAGFLSFTYPMLMWPDSWMQTAGIDDMALTMMYYVHILGNGRKQMNLASIVSWMLFVIMGIIIFVLFKLQKRSEGNV